MSRAGTPGARMAPSGAGVASIVRGLLRRITGRERLSDAAPPRRGGEGPMARKESHTFARGSLLYPARAARTSAAGRRRCDISGCDRPCTHLVAEPNGSLLLVCAACADRLAAGSRRRRDRRD